MTHNVYFFLQLTFSIVYFHHDEPRRNSYFFLYSYCICNTSLKEEGKNEIKNTNITETKKNLQGYFFLKFISLDREKKLKSTEWERERVQFVQIKRVKKNDCRKGEKFFIQILALSKLRVDDDRWCGWLDEEEDDEGVVTDEIPPAAACS